MADNLQLAIKAALNAGKEILDIYSTNDYNIELKTDESPITIADKNAHKVILEILGQTQYPVLSEEGKHLPFKERSKWDYFWLVDPLDGTKEFIKKNGEFTVNIALVTLIVPVTDPSTCSTTACGKTKSKTVRTGLRINPKNRINIKPNSLEDFADKINKWKIGEIKISTMFIQIA